VAIALLLSGCSHAPLTNSYPSIETLAAAAIDGFARRDAAALRALAVSEGEFRAHIWPELPAARPERNLPFSYVWGDLRQKSEQSLGASLARHGGRRYALVEVRFAGEPIPYASYTVHRDTVVTLGDEQGREMDLRLFGSAVETAGSWKVFSYVVD
jgi:hypothetical protein